jgi:hypothetical protein
MQTEKAWEVARCPLKEIIPRFGIPVSIGSDNGPAFVAKVVQLMTKDSGNHLKVAYSLLLTEFRKRGTQTEP